VGFILSHEQKRMDESAHFFIGEDLAELKLDSDETEFIQVQPFPLKKLFK
jgi:hypothetical protein